MEKKDQKTKLGILFCVLGAMSWGISGAVSEAFFKFYTVDTSWVTAVRMLSSGSLMMIWILIKERDKIRMLIKERNSIIQILIFSLLGLTFCQFAYLSAIRWSNAGTATVLQNLSIVFVAVFVCISTKQLPQKKIIICIVLALIGVWLISTGGKIGNMKMTMNGLFWGISAALGAAAYSLLSRKPVERWGSILVTGTGMLIGGVVLSFVVGIWKIPTGLDIRAVLFLMVIILVGTIGAFTFFLQGISMIGPVKATLLGCLEPLTATTLSALWLHSNFSVTDLIGFVCILIMVFLSC